MFRRRFVLIGAFFVMASYAFVFFLVGELFLTDVHDKGDEGHEHDPMKQVRQSGRRKPTSKQQRVLGLGFHAWTHNSGGRFPKYGTPEFEATCAWALKISPEIQSLSKGCTIMVRPPADGGEGLSNWISQVVAGHLMSKQAGCDLLIDYGPGVDVQEVLLPRGLNEQTDVETIDWRVYTNELTTHCTPERDCFFAGPDFARPESMSPFVVYAARRSGAKLGLIPCVRHAYKLSRPFFEAVEGFHDLEHAIPQFTDIETVMGCSISSLFQLAPNAAKFEPSLFTDIIPKLQAKDVLSLGVYIRTGATDGKVHSFRTAEYIVNCAKKAETEMLLSSTQQYNSIVWMVATDSPNVKKWVKSNNRPASGEVLERQIITTSARGKHSKPAANPTTEDFAEAYIDWYLLGETDAMVGDELAPTFGDTAAFRTARPYYKDTRATKGDCARIDPVFRWK